MNLAEYINVAIAEAHKHYVKANAVLLNKNVVLVREGYLQIGSSIKEFPPMICGLTAILTDELPDNAAFVVTQIQSFETKVEKARREAKQELIEELRTKSLAEIVEMIETQRGDNF